MKNLALALSIIAVAPPAAARPVLLELFTSQSCSSCPPAEALLAQLQTAPDVTALSFHVDYWDYLSWRDPYSSRAATDRQRHYAAALGSEVFTPQLVVDGRGSAVGSDEDAVRAAIVRAKAAQAAGPPVTATTSASGLAVHVGAGGRAAADVLVVGYDPFHETRVAAGENGGVVLRETNVVRSQAVAGRWTGQALDLAVPRPAGVKTAVIVQQDDGTVLSAAFP